MSIELSCLPRKRGRGRDSWNLPHPQISIHFSSAPCRLQIQSEAVFERNRWCAVAVKERPARWGTGRPANPIPCPCSTQKAQRHFQLPARTFSFSWVQGALLKGTSWRAVLFPAKSRRFSSCLTECSRLQLIAMSCNQG